MQAVDAVTDRKLALFSMTRQVLGAASQARRVRALAELGHELLHALAIGGEHLVR